MMDSTALAKIQSLLLIAVITVAAVGAVGVYVLSNKPLQAEDIRIGICADLDNSGGKRIWQAAVLAAEEVNALGGILNRNLTIVAEDDNDEASTPDLAVISNAMIKLITVDEADFVISAASSSGPALIHQDISAEHKKILFFVRNSNDELTQRVVDEYDKYKYTFRVYLPNSTAYSQIMREQIKTLGNYTGFSKIAFLGHDTPTVKNLFSSLNKSLSTIGFDVVYIQYTKPGTTDFASYFAAIEASGAEILVPYFVSTVSATFVKEYYDRQSPFVVSGFLGLAGDSNFWELTEGKCEYTSFVSVPAVAKYPLTNKTQPTLNAYLERWGDKMPGPSPFSTYDLLRFLLPDAIQRAGTTETEAVIKALESTDIETSLARHFQFTSSHDVLIGVPGMKYPVEDYLLHCTLQWQANQVLAVVVPEVLMREGGTSYKYPSWQGPWTK